MQKGEAKVIVPIIGFIVGWVAVGNIVAGLALGALVGYIQYIIFFNPDKQEPDDTIFGEGEDFINVVLLLSAAVIKADGRIYKKELELVRQRLIHDFGPTNVEKYMIDLNVCLKKKIRIESVCNAVNHTMDYPSKIQLLHFLTGLTVTNGLIIDNEFNLLRKITRLIQVPERSFASILAMFNFQRIHSYDKAKSKSNYRRTQTKTTSTSALEKAYRILEINSSATGDEVKKAYRRLAKIHHPDRVTHLGPEFQKNAKVKFQKISDAYELIKERKGFK